MACIPKDNPEFKKLENDPEIGRFEASKDWMEYGTIRTPEEVKAKLAENAKIRDVIPSKSKNSKLEQLVVDTEAFTRVGEAGEDGNYFHVKKNVTESYTALEEKLNIGRAEKDWFTIDKDGRLHIPELSKKDTELFDDTRLPGSTEQLSAFMREPTGPGVTSYEDPKLDINSTKFTAGIEIAKKLSDLFEIPYTLYTTDTEADANFPGGKGNWKGEPGWYDNQGRVHLVASKLSSETAIHEFSHPFVDYIFDKTPEVFNGLYNKVTSTPEGQEIVNTVTNLYTKEGIYTKHFEVDSPGFKKEVLVRALTQDVLNKLKSIEPTSEFSKFIKDFLYAIKQAIRKVFGVRSKVEDLKSDTSLGELSDMLIKGDRFKLSEKPLSEKDITQYMVSELEDLSGKRIKPETLQSLVDISSKNVNNLFRSLKSDPDYKLPADILGMEDSELARIKDLIGTYKTSRNKEELHTKLEKLREDIQLRADQSYAWLESMDLMHTSAKKIAGYIDSTGKHIEGHLEKLVKNFDNKDNGQQMLHYNKFIDKWLNYTKDMQKLLHSDDYSTDEPAYKKLNEIKTSLESAKRMFTEHAVNVVLPIMERELKHMKDRIDTDYKLDLEYGKSHGRSQKTQDILNKRYAEERLTTEKYKEIIAGYGKAGWGDTLSNYVESFFQNQDPAIMSLLSYINKGHNEHQAKSVDDINNLINEVKPLLKASGLNRGKISAIFDKIGFEDSQWLHNPETGKYEEQKVLTMLNNFKNYAFDRDRMEHDIDKLADEAISRNDPKDAQSWKDIREKRQEFNQWKNDYIYQEYTPEYYERFKEFTSTDIGRAAKEEMDDFYQKKNAHNERNKFENNYDDLQENAFQKALDQEEKQLTSEVYLNGEKKQGDVLERVLVRKRYKELSKDMHDYILKNNAFQDARELFQQSLINKGISKDDPATEDEYNIKMKSWDNNNLRKKLTKDYSDKVKKHIDVIKDLMSRLDPEDAKKMDISEQYTTIYDIAKSHKDSDYQTNATEYTPGETKLSKEEQNIINRKKAAYTSSQRLKNLSIIERALLEANIKALSELQGKTPTEFYVDRFNSFLDEFEGKQVDTGIIRSLTGSTEMTKENAEMITNSDHIIEQLSKESPEFKKWFEANHVRKTSYDQVADNGSMIEHWERLYAWSMTEPKDPKAYETTPVYDSEGNIKEVLQGAPHMKYYRRMVKKQFFTGYNSATGEIKHIVGLHVDNKGDFLPRLPEHGAKDNKYLNQAYFDLKNSKDARDIASYKLLEAIKKQSLKDDEGLDKQDKLWHQLPRFRKGELEILQSGTPGAVIHNQWEKLKSYFIRRQGDDSQEIGNNPDFLDNTKDNAIDGAKIDLLEPANLKIDTRLAPVGGVYHLPVDQVSKDVMAAIMTRTVHANRNKKMKELQPVALDFKKLFGDPTAVEGNIVKTKKGYMLNGHDYDPDHRKVRAKAVNFLYDREFKHIMTTGIGKDNKTFVATAHMLQGFAAKSFFALNFPGAVQNMFGPIWQGVMEGFAGKYWDLKDLGAGMSWAMKAMSEQSMSLYNQDLKSLSVQMVQQGDMVAGNIEKNLGRIMSRSLGRDVASMSWLTSFRKWTEDYATLALAGARMNHVVLKRNMPDGTTAQVRMLHAYELGQDGKIKLLDGIDPEYSHRAIEHTVVEGDNYTSLAKKYHISVDRLKELNPKGLDLGSKIKIANGEAYSREKTIFHEISRRNQSQYSTFEQGQINADTLGNQVIFLKNFFLPMFMDRWGVRRYNIGTGEMTQGFYMTAMSNLFSAIKNMDYKLLYTPSHIDNGLAKRAYMKLFTEVGMVIGITMLYKALFGWDPNDKDRYEKLKDKSGALPLPFVTDDPSHPFHVNGYLANHALSLMMRIENENNQWLPVPGLGLDNYVNMMHAKSYALGPTLDSYSQLIGDIYHMAAGDKTAYYAKSVGAYDWMQEGMPKIFKHISSTVGLTGKDMQPIDKIRSMEQNASSSNRR